MSLSNTNSVANFDALPDSALVRQKQILQLVPFSHVTLWRLCRDDKFPKPRKLKDVNATVWTVGDVRAWLAAQAVQA